MMSGRLMILMVFLLADGSAASQDKILSGTIIGTAAYSGYSQVGAFDGDTNTFFAAAGANSWVGLDLGPGAQAQVTRILFTPRSGFQDRMSGGHFQGANLATFADAQELAAAPFPAAGVAGTSTVASVNAATFRYLRYISGTGVIGDAAEIQFYGIPNRYRLAGTVIGTTATYDATTTRAAPFDGKLTTFFDGGSSGANGSWCGLDLGAGNAECITAIRFFTRSGSQARLNNGVFQGGNMADFTDAETLFAVGATDNPPITGTEVAVGTATPFRYLRFLSADGTYGGNPTELEFIGHPNVALTTAPPTGTFRNGDTVVFKATFTAPVVMTGAPQLILDQPAGITLDAVATDSRTLSFSYTVHLADPSSSQVMVQGLVLNGGQINDTFGNAADLTGASGGSFPVVIDTTSPLTPSTLTATPMSTTRIDLLWGDNADSESGFTVGRSTVSGGPYTTIATLPANTTSYQDTGLTWRTTYYYQVSSFNSNGHSDSNEATAATDSNTAPTLVPNTTLAALSLKKNSIHPIGAVGTLVSSVITVANDGTGVVTDIDPGAITGIAVHGVNNTNGTWYYSTNNGTTWQTFPLVSGTGALLLAADSRTRLYFQPHQEWTGSSLLQYHAWDQSTGTAGATVNPLPGGGTTAFSVNIGFLQALVGEYIQGVDVSTEGTGGVGKCGVGSGLSLVWLAMLVIALRQCLVPHPPRGGGRWFSRLMALACVLASGSAARAAERSGDQGGASTPDRLPSARASRPEDQQLDRFFTMPPLPDQRGIAWIGIGIMPQGKLVDGFAGDAAEATSDWGIPWRLRVGIERISFPREFDSFFYGVETGVMSVQGRETYRDTHNDHGQRVVETGSTVIPLTLHAGWRWVLTENMQAELGAFGGAGITFGTIDYTVFAPGKGYEGMNRALGHYTEGGLRGAYLWKKGSWIGGLDLRWQMLSRSTVKYTITENYNDGQNTATVPSRVGFDGLAATLVGGFWF